MSDETQMPEDPSVPDPKEVERLMKLAVENPSLQGPMFRALLAARLWVPVPAHPELEGDHERRADAPLTMKACKDAEGTFIPIFTTHEEAEHRLAKLQGPLPMVAELPARVLIAHLRAAGTEVRVYGGNEVCITLRPDAVEMLAKGEFTESSPNTGGEAEKTSLMPLAAEQMPSKLRQAIRVFCAQRQGAMAVYAFNLQDEATGAVDELDIRIIVRLRDNAGHFYNDFQLMVHKTVPKPYSVLVGAARMEDTAGMAFLERCTPLWPILKGA